MGIGQSQYLREVAKLFFSENSFFFPYWKGRNYPRDKKISQEFNSYFQQDEKVMSWAAVSQFKRSGCNNCTLFFTLELLEEFLAVQVYNIKNKFLRFIYSSPVSSSSKNPFQKLNNRPPAEGKYLHFMWKESVESVNLIACTSVKKKINQSKNNFN